jgi:hypothetical protein
MKAGLLTQTIAELSCTNQQLGGAKNSSSSQGVNKMQFTLTTFFLILLGIFIKGLIVYLGYNLIMPKLMYSVGSGNKSLAEIEANFRPLNYVESVILVILTNTLF